MDIIEGKVKCNAKSKQSGVQCKKYALPGKTKCAMHGGKSLSGLAHPNTKTGRYSKVLPARLVDKYEQARDDPGLLTLREDIALLEGRLEDVLGRVDSGESGRLWNQANAAVLELRAARAKGDNEGVAEALNSLVSIIQKGHLDYAAWNEVGSLIDQRRRLIESERKRMIESHLMISSDRAMLLISAIAAAIKEEIKDRNLLQRINNRIMKIAQEGGA